MIPSTQQDHEADDEAEEEQSPIGVRRKRKRKRGREQKELRFSIPLTQKEALETSGTLYQPTA